MLPWIVFSARAKAAVGGPEYMKRLAGGRRDPPAAGAAEKTQ